jgi:NDP-sugar pyrophosphorylase family protein
VVGLREKPTYREIISTGMYVVSPKVLDRIPEGQQYDVTDLMRTLIDEGKVVHSHLFEEPWVAIEQAGELVDVAQNREWTMWADGLEHQNLQKLSEVKIEN